MFDALPPADPPQPVIIVTGTALPDPSAEQAYHVDTIDRRELQDSAGQSLDKVLQQLPGLQLFRRSSSDTGHPTSQGMTLRALGGNASSRALLVLDGVPQTDPFGGWVNWPAYDPAGLAEVRVVRGGGSVGYGPGALAGTIDMRSFADAGFASSIEGGTRKSLNGGLYGGIKAGDALLTANAQAMRSEGFVPITKSTRGPVDRRAPFEQASLRARAMLPVGDKLELQLAGLGFSDERERGQPFTTNRTSGADASIRLVSSGRLPWSVVGYGQWRDFRSNFASVSDGRLSASQVAKQHVPSSGWGASVEMRPHFGSTDLRIGADIRHTGGDSREMFAYVGGKPTRHRTAGGNSRTEGLFAEVSEKFGRLTLSGGARVDHWQISDGELVERPLAGGPPSRDDQYPRRDGWQPTGRLGAVLAIAYQTELRVAAYRGWRMPTLNELFRPFRAGADATAANAALKPETLMGIEAGLGYRRDGIDLSLTTFANRLSDAIANVTLGRGPGQFPGVGFVAGDYRQRQNLDSIRVRGVEASAAYRRGPWSLHFGASYSHARVDDDAAAAPLDGLRPAQTPKLILTGGFGWEDRGRQIQLDLHHAGSQFEDDLNRTKLKPATTVDAFLGWSLSQHLQLFARAENLLDELVVAGVGDDGAVERATPRTLWLGIRLRAD